MFVNAIAMTSGRDKAAVKPQNSVKRLRRANAVLYRSEDGGDRKPSLSALPQTPDQALIMSSKPTSHPDGAAARRRLRRWLPLIVLAVLTAVVFGMGWHRQLTFETLARYRDVIHDLVVHHQLAAVAGYIGLYIAVVALSIPGGVFLTVAGGLLFGGLLGGAAAVCGATLGAIGIFLIARTAVGEQLVRRAGALAVKLAEGFRADAFNYLLFLRLVPLFPFWLVNLVPALLGVPLATFAAATAIGIVPATFAFAFVGAGLDSVISAQEAAYRSCLAAAKVDCRLDFDIRTAITPQLLVALAALGVIALVPVAVKRLRSRSRGSKLA